MAVRFFWMVLAILVLLPTVAGAQSTPTVGSDSVESDIITLQPGDVIQVEIWREEDLTGEFTVNEDGVVTLPLLGEKKVTGIPMKQLRDVLVEEYKVHLKNPSINVTPLRKILVLGEVRTPGPYDVSPTETLLGVVALAGGPTEAGNVKNIRVLRDGRTIVENAAPGATLSGIDIRSGDQIVVQPRSWLARNRGFVVSLLLAIPSVVFTISRIDLGG